MKAVVVDCETIVDNKVTIVRAFRGDDALQQAETFVGTLPGVERGRYGIDACIPGEGHCDDCGCPPEE
jgi:hypothetical protein